MSQNYPIYNLGNLYKTGLKISNDATTPNTVLDIAAGQCRDSNDVMDIVLGSANLEGSTVAAPLLLNAAVNGANGLDTGSLAASSMYAIYMIADSRYIKPVASILSLASNSSPTLPGGYDSYRLIGYWPTDGSSHFLAGKYSATGSLLQFNYDAPIQILSGNQAAYTGVDLTAFVPPVDAVNLNVFVNFTANAAADVFNMKGYNQAGDAVSLIAPVAGATAHTTAQAAVLAELNTAAPSIKYKVSAGSVVLDLISFQVNI